MSERHISMTERAARPSALFVAAGSLFAVYALVRPYSAQTGVDTAVQFASPWWLIAHTAAMVGFVITVAAVFTLGRAVDGTSAGRIAELATAVTGIGTALVLPYYGAETLALHALGSAAVAEGNTGELPAAEAIRFGGLATVMFGAGLIALIGAALLVAIAVRRAHGPLVLVAAYVVVWALFPVQYFVPATARMGYGVLVAAGFIALAVALSGRMSYVRENADARAI